MPTIADIYREAPANAPTVNKLPTETLLDAYLIGIKAAYDWTGLSVPRESGRHSPTFMEGDGTFQVTETRMSGYGEARTGFHASDPERLQVVEGLVVVNNLGRVARSLFQVSNDGGATHREFLFSRRAWDNLVGLIAERGDSFQADTTLHLIPPPEE